MGIASLVLGIIAFITAITFVFAPLGVILTVVGLILGIHLILLLLLEVHLLKHLHCQLANGELLQNIILENM